MPIMEDKNKDRCEGRFRSKLHEKDSLQIVNVQKICLSCIIASFKKQRVRR